MRAAAGTSLGTSSYNANSSHVQAQQTLNLRVGVRHNALEVSIFSNNITNAHAQFGNAGNGHTVCAVSNATCSSYVTDNPFVSEAFQRPRVIGAQANYRF